MKKILIRFEESIANYIETLNIPAFESSDEAEDLFDTNVQVLKDIIGSFADRSKYSKILKANRRTLDEDCQRFIRLFDK